MMMIDVKRYLDTIELFIERKITAAEFDNRYSRIFLSDNRIFPASVFDVLQRLFSDVDSFVDDDEIRREDDLDEDMLLLRSREAYDHLRSIVED